MSKLTIILFVIFIAILATLISLNTLYAPYPVLKSLPAIFPTKAVYSENSLSLSPNPLRIQPGKQNVIQVLIDTTGETPSVIQMELSYDPSIFSSVKLNPGTFFQTPEVLLNSVNTRNGRISYAIAPSKKAQTEHASNIVATIILTPRVGIERRETNLTFLPKTAVKTENKENTLKAAYGTKLLLPNVVIPDASSSAGPDTISPN